MIVVRVSWEKGSEKRKAISIARRIAREYGGRINFKVYRNRKNSGGRIYITLFTGVKT